MKHVKPLSRAALTWFDSGPLDIVNMILSVLTALAPLLSLITGAKQPAGT